MSAFIHPKGICDTESVGDGTRIWAFTHILDGAVIGSDCNICDHVFIEEKVKVGDRVTVKCGVQLWNGLYVGNDVFIGPNATFTNDLFPRSGDHSKEIEKTVLEDGCSIGAGAVVLCGVTIGRGAMVGAGSVVTQSVPPHAVVKGNPARIDRFLHAVPSGDGSQSRASEAPNTDANIFTLPVIKDLRGDLLVAEFSKHLPFTPKRSFLVLNVPSRRIRGEHAHKKCEQFLICLRGSCKVMMDDGKTRTEHVLDDPGTGLYIPPMVWAAQYKHTEDAMLLVFASDEYDADDYIRNFEDFLTAIPSS